MNVLRKRRRGRLGWRRVLGFLAATVTVVGLAITFAVRTPSPVGHWNSAAGQDAFLADYDAAFADLPKPAQTFDLRTSYGLVRVYRFTTTRPAGQPATDPLVLLPGTRSATPVWADNMPSLLGIADVYSVDLLGEPGRSIQERPITSAADEAAWLHEVLVQLPGDSYHLVGLSIGGWTAANLALHHPEQINTLTLIDPINVFGPIPWRTALRSLPAAVSWFPKSWRDGFNSYTAGGAPVEDVPVADMIESGMQHYTLKKPQPVRIEEDQLRTLEMPVLAFIAGRSVMHDATATEVAERSLTHGTVRTYPDASHAINGEHPDELAADLAKFLAANR